LNRKETSAAPKEVGKTDFQEGKEVWLAKRKRKSCWRTRTTVHILEKEKRMFCTRGIKTVKGRKRNFSIGRVDELNIV
jgi:hypothetical protein